MARRRFVTATELAAELDCTVDEVLGQVRAGNLRILAPPRRVTSVIPDMGERGGGLDLGGRLAFADQSLTAWLKAYLEVAPPHDRVVAAAKAGRPYSDGLRLYVRPDAMAAALRERFHPSPRPDQIADALKGVSAQRGTVLGLALEADGGRLLWWRLPDAVVKKVTSDD